MVVANGSRSCPVAAGVRRRHPGPSRDNDFDRRTHGRGIYILDDILRYNSSPARLRMMRRIFSTFGRNDLDERHSPSVTQAGSKWSAAQIRRQEPGLATT